MPVGHWEESVHFSPQYVGGGLPFAENSQMGLAVPPGAAGHVVPVHLGMHMQPPKGNLAGTAREGVSSGWECLRPALRLD